MGICSKISTFGFVPPVRKAQAEVYKNHLYRLTTSCPYDFSCGSPRHSHSSICDVQGCRHATQLAHCKRECWRDYALHHPFSAWDQQLCAEPVTNFPYLIFSTYLIFGASLILILSLGIRTGYLDHIVRLQHLCCDTCFMHDGHIFRLTIISFHILYISSDSLYLETLALS